MPNPTFKGRSVQGLKNKKELLANKKVILTKTPTGAKNTAKIIDGVKKNIKKLPADLKKKINTPKIKQAVKKALENKGLPSDNKTVGAVASGVASRQGLIVTTERDFNTIYGKPEYDMFLAKDYSLFDDLARKEYSVLDKFLEKREKVKENIEKLTNNVKIVNGKINKIQDETTKNNFKVKIFPVQNKIEKIKRVMKSGQSKDLNDNLSFLPAIGAVGSAVEGVGSLLFPKKSAGKDDKTEAGKNGAGKTGFPSVPGVDPAQIEKLMQGQLPEKEMPAVKMSIKSGLSVLTFWNAFLVNTNKKVEGINKELDNYLYSGINSSFPSSSYAFPLSVQGGVSREPGTPSEEKFFVNTAIIAGLGAVLLLSKKRKSKKRAVKNG